MTANIDTILLLGATSGIGEAFARYFHGKGKRVIAAGRRLERLDALKSELKGLETFQMDVEDIPAIEPKLNELFKTYPDLDSVFVIAGIMTMGQFKDPSTTSTKGIVSEVTTNLIAPMVIARTVVPHLLSLKRPTTFITVTSGLAYMPLPFFPVYNATKAGVHNFTVVLRTQLTGTNVNVIEVAPPYVATDLDVKFREEQNKMQGGKGHPPMPLKEYMDVTTKQLEEGKDKELATGFSAMGVSAWRGAFQPLLDQFGFAG
ncbi:NAD(P)-binding protein [Mollisia scopiformis]|uniref:NAD(P)-binding protein n=1 Tax=Mollisia scopiformis TaxID=149040 RepID=A0A194XD45_MOLSC|nr:NAD(P)-binding protein [Mollisia scopiformis]KUJ18079.1 NAD(P)-binding protein [Mollisia scopiformis]